MREYSKVSKWLLAGLVGPRIKQKISLELRYLTSGLLHLNSSCATAGVIVPLPSWQLKFK
ncbi:hypothetical protein B9Z19DRAFT_1071289 [Tuber borchii]|uniref:Uncharacterized protein n=1 Tax=Tuber borchii TaxID=42251 RepID=A0A2T7A8F9_TUBBO|nr:hypothetical protein B9Z19DRAFT_1071289 [Tuber borchii]